MIDVLNEAPNIPKYFDPQDANKSDVDSVSPTWDEEGARVRIFRVKENKLKLKYFQGYILGLSSFETGLLWKMLAWKEA